MNNYIQKFAWRIVVIDDDEMLNYLFCSFLNSKGFETISITSIADAKDILRRDDAIDLILLDYQLGDGIGMDLLSPDAVASYAGLPPVIMISANEEPEYLEACFSGGVNDYIIKPVNLSLLALKVESLIKSVSMQRLIELQNSELERFKLNAEREEQIAKFTYEYLLKQNASAYDGVWIWQRSFAAFSGDMMLVKKSPNGNLYAILADATGHGLSAAITIMPVVTIFNSMVTKGFHVQQIVTEINRKLVKDTPADRFVAAILLEINPFKRELNVWNGGMPPVYWVNEGHIIHTFNSAHMALGILEDDVFDAGVHTLDLPRKGALLIYSDGLVEQENADGKSFSMGNVVGTIEKRPDNLAKAFEQALSEFVGSEDYDDDVTLCVMEPSKIFDSAVYAVSVNPQMPAALCHLNNFKWHVHLSGDQLGQCDIPPLCNHFLQQIGVDQQCCQKIFVVVAEMVSNAIDHGVLQLSSELKARPDGFMEFFQERERRLKQLTEKDYINLSLEVKANLNGEHYLLIDVEDSGQGYEVADEVSSDNNLAFSGRGSLLIRQLSSSVEVIPPGNKIRATIK